MALGNRGIVGEIVDVRRRGGELHLDWRIPRFLELHCGGNGFYDSPGFVFHDARWHLRVRPNWRSCGGVFLDLRRDDDDGGPSTRRVTFSLDLRGSGGGVEKRTAELEWEFKSLYHFFCKRSELSEQKERLMPGGTLTIVCQMRVPGTAATDASTQTNAEFKEASIDGKLSSEKQDALDDDSKGKLNGNNDRESDDESEKKKDLNLLSRIKNTKKISLPARHGDVIRSLKAILAEGRRADFSLKSGGGERRVHRAILEGRSDHFEALFRGEWADRDEVRLDDVPEGALDGVLHFAYAGEVGDMSAESVCGIYEAAHRFLLEDLKSQCVEYMKERMCPEMVCGALAVAETHGEGDLKERAMECFFRESGTICETEGWKELKANHPAIIAELFWEFIRRERKNRKKERD